MHTFRLFCQVLFRASQVPKRVHRDSCDSTSLCLVLPCLFAPVLLCLDADRCILPVTALQEPCLRPCLSPGAKECHCLPPLLQGAWPGNPPAPLRRAGSTVDSFPAAWPGGRPASC